MKKVYLGSAVSCILLISNFARADFYSRDRLSRERIRQEIEEADQRNQERGARQIQQNLALTLGRSVVQSGASEWQTTDGSIICRAEAYGLESYHVTCLDPDGRFVARLDDGQLNERPSRNRR